MSGKIWLARHGETTWNVAGRYQGRLESLLSEMGEWQVTALAAYFGARALEHAEVPARVVTSPMVRCTQTARPCAEALGIGIERDARLIEVAHGAWEGRYRDEIAANDPRRYRRWREDPAHVSFEGGESLGDVLGRWRSFAEDLARDDRATLVVTHDAVIRCALIDATDKTLDEFWKPKVSNAAFALLARDAGRLRVVEPYCAAHLGELEIDTTSQAL